MVMSTVKNSLINVIKLTFMAIIMHFAPHDDSQTEIIVPAALLPYMY